MSLESYKTTNALNKIKIKTKKSKPNYIPNLKPQSNTCLEVSNHLPGTKDRSAMICWLPKNWGDLQSTVDKAKLMIQDEKLGSCGFWYSNGRVLMICPRSIPRAKLVKIFKKYKSKILLVFSIFWKHANK